MSIRKAIIGILTLSVCFQSTPVAEEFAQTQIGAHLAPIRAIAADHSGETAYTAAKDGSIVKWDLKKKRAQERFQVSPFGITSLALRPNTDELAVVETDGYGLYRVSAWNFKEKRKLFTLRFRDAVNCIAYSEKGSFLIVSRNSYDGIVLLNPETGEKTSHLQETTGLVTFVSTGKSERTMVTYSRSGELCYWNIGTGERFEKFKAPEELSNIVLFGNGRYLFGSTEKEMVISEATSSKEIARRSVDGLTAAFPIEGNGFDLIYLLETNGLYSVGTLSLAEGRSLAVANERNIVSSLENAIAFPAVYSGSVLLSAQKDGRIAEIALSEPVPSASTLAAAEFSFVKDVSDAGSYLVALVDDSAVYIPAMPEAVKSDDGMRRIDGIPENRLLALDDKRIVFWRQDGSSPPRILGPAGSSADVAVRTGPGIIAVDRFKETLLFLDAGGMLTLYDAAKQNVLFTYSSIGVLDAALVDDRRVLLGKSSSVAPKVPLLMLNYLNGETVPLDIPGKAAVRVTRGLAGALYAIIADGEGSETVTKLVKIAPDQTQKASALIEYRAEDVQASIVDQGEYLATTLGGDGASIFKATDFISLERTEYLPKKLTVAGPYLVSIGEDGAIVWYDPQSGKIEATLRFRNNSWELEKKDAPPLRGPLVP